MNSKKRTVLIICIVVVVVAIMGIATTLFLLLNKGGEKSSSTSNAKNVLVTELAKFFQSSEDVEGMLSEYFDKKGSEASKNQGSIEIDGQIDGELIGQNMPKINFSGKSDPANRKAEQNIEIAYSDTVKFPINYRQDGDVFGLQTESVSQKYVALENNNLQEFVGKLGISDTSTIPNKIEIPESGEIEFTEEELQQLKDNYLPIISDATDEKIYITDGTSSDEKIYRIKFTGSEMIDLLSKLSEALENDNVLLNKLDTINDGTSDMVKSAVESFKDEISTSESVDDLDESESAGLDQDITLMKTTTQNAIINFEMDVGENTTLTFERSYVKDEDYLSYSFSFKTDEDGEDTELSVIISFTGISSRRSNRRMFNHIIRGRRIFRYQL